MSSGIQFSLGFRAAVSDVVLEFAGPNAGGSASVLLLNTPDFWANDGNGPKQTGGKKKEYSDPPYGSAHPSSLHSVRTPRGWPQPT